jgi:hypothetical protein
MDPQTFTAQNPRFNATLNQAHQIQSDLISQGISKNPRIYADQYISGGCMVPETSSQDNSDLPGWATENWDGSTTLQNVNNGSPLDPNQPVYLSILVAEGAGGANGDDNFCDVFQIILDTAGGMTLARAVNVSQ